MNSPVEFFSRWVPVAAYAGFIFFLSSRSTIPGQVALVPDKAAHGILYAGLGALLARALTNGGRLSKITRGVTAVLLATAYGVSDEWHQSFVPHRSAELADVVADFVGAALGVLAYLVFASRFVDATTHTGGR